MHNEDMFIQLDEFFQSIFLFNSSPLIITNICVRALNFIVWILRDIYNLMPSQKTEKMNGASRDHSGLLSYSNPVGSRRVNLYL